RTTIVTTAMFAMSYGAAFGAIQQMPQIAPGMPDVVANVERQTEAESTQAAVDERLASPRVQRMLEGKSPDEQAEIIAAETKAARQIVKRRVEQTAASNYTKVQEVGGLIGRFCFALLVVRIISRRAVLRVFQFPGLLITPVVFGLIALNNRTLFELGGTPVTMFGIGIFFVGLFTVAQFSFWGNYLPQVYPLHLRGTGESFAANISGRMNGTSFDVITRYLSTFGFSPDDHVPLRMVYAASADVLFVYVVVFGLSFLLP